MGLVFRQLPIHKALGNIENNPILECAMALKPPRVFIIPHPHSLRMPSLIITTRIPSGYIHIVHPQSWNAGPSYSCPSPGANPGVMWQMRIIANSPISPESTNCFNAW